MKLFYRNNGVITIMLVILLVPVLMASTVLVEMIRYQSSSQLLDMAVNSAAMSALADYDKTLYKKFGLLAVEGQQDEEVKAWLKENLNGAGNVFSKIADLAALTVTVDELYGLDDVDVLKRQIMEAEKYQGPFEFIEGVVGVTVGVDDFFKALGKQMDKALPGLKAFKASSEVMNSAGEAANQCIDLYEKYQEWLGAVTAYENAHRKFLQAYNGALAWHEGKYGTYESRTAQDPKGSETGDVLDGRHGQITSAKEEYLAAMEDLNSKWGALCDSAASVAEKCADTVENIGDRKVTIRQEERDQQKKAEKEDVKNDTNLTDKEREERNQQIDDAYKQKGIVENTAVTSLTNQNNLMAAIGNTLTGFSSSVFKEFAESNINALKQGLTGFKECEGLLEEKEVEVEKTEIKLQDGLPTTVTTKEKEKRFYATASLGDDSFYRPVEDLVGDGLNYIKDTIKQLEEDYQEEELELFEYFDMMKYILSFVTGDGAALYDSVANNTITPGAEEGFALPGGGMTSSRLGFTTGDEEMVTALLEQMQAVRDVMEYNVDSMYPANRHAVAQQDVAVENAIQSAIHNLTTVCEYITTVRRALQGRVLDMLKAVRDFGGCINAICGLVDNLTFLASNIQLVFENVLEKMYEGVMINGYVLGHFTSRADIEPYNRGLGIFSPIEHTNFKYAQSEYVVAGGMDEKENQKNVTMSLYFIRFLMNIPTVLLDNGLQTLSASAGPFAPVVLLLFMGIETVLDVVALQGIDCRIPILKSHPFLSGSTLANMASALGEQVRDKSLEPISKVQLGTDVESILNTLENSIIQPIVESMFKNDHFKMDYEDYLWVRMCLVSNETKIRRIADLIYMEMYQQHTGFSLGKEYTYLRVKVDGGYTTVMPLYDVLEATRITSVKYCGF